MATEYINLLFSVDVAGSKRRYTVLNVVNFVILYDVVDKIKEVERISNSSYKVTFILVLYI